MDYDGLEWTTMDNDECGWMTMDWRGARHAGALT